MEAWFETVTRILEQLMDSCHDLQKDLRLASNRKIRNLFIIFVMFFVWSLSYI